MLQAFATLKFQFHNKVVCHTLISVTPFWLGKHVGSILNGNMPNWLRQRDEGVGYSLRILVDMSQQGSCLHTLFYFAVAAFNLTFPIDWNWSRNYIYSLRHQTEALSWLHSMMPKASSCTPDHAHVFREYVCHRKGSKPRSQFRL